MQRGSHEPEYKSKRIEYGLNKASYNHQVQVITKLNEYSTIYPGKLLLADKDVSKSFRTF